MVFIVFQHTYPPAPLCASTTLQSPVCLISYTEVKVCLHLSCPSFITLFRPHLHRSVTTDVSALFAKSKTIFLLHSLLKHLTSAASLSPLSPSRTCLFIVCASRHSLLLPLHSACFLTRSHLTASS